MIDDSMYGSPRPRAGFTPDELEHAQTIYEDGTDCHLVQSFDSLPDADVRAILASPAAWWHAAVPTAPGAPLHTRAPAALKMLLDLREENDAQCGFLMDRAHYGSVKEGTPAYRDGELQYATREAENPLIEDVLQRLCDLADRLSSPDPGVP